MRYRQDPRWVSAQRDYVLDDRSQSADEQMVRRYLAANAMHAVEREYEAAA